MYLNKPAAQPKSTPRGPNFLVAYLYKTHACTMALARSLAGLLSVARSFSVLDDLGTLGLRQGWWCAVCHA